MATAVGSEFAAWSRSPAVRGRYAETTQRATRPLDANEHAVLEQNVACLELFQVGALTCEFIEARGLQTFEDLLDHGSAFDRHVRSAFQDFDAVAALVSRALGDLDLSGAAASMVSTQRQIDWSQWIRMFDAVVAECPIEAIEALGERLDDVSLRYRARSAYDALRAFVRRHDPNRAGIMRIVGEQYRRGHISLAEAAQLLDLSTSDTVFELELNGYGRSAEVIALTPDERDAIYARLRQVRLARRAPPSADPDLVARDVIASERIESVDARAWIRRR